MDKMNVKPTGRQNRPYKPDINGGRGRGGRKYPIYGRSYD